MITGTTKTKHPLIITADIRQSRRLSFRRQFATRALFRGVKVTAAISGRGIAERVAADLQVVGETRKRVSRSANHTLCASVCGRDRPQLQFRALVITVRGTARVIYPSHPESDRACASGPGRSHFGAPETRSPCSPANPVSEAMHLYHRTAAAAAAAVAAELRGETAYRRCRCRGTDRIGLPCGPRRYLRSIISGIYRCRRQPRAVLRPTRANDIP